MACFKIFSFVALLCAAGIAASEIEAAIRGRCPDVCKSDVEALFFSCAAKISDGCALKFCNDGGKRVRCGLKSGLPDFVYPGEIVTLSNTKIGVPFTLNVGFGGSRSKTDLYLLVDGTGSMGGALEIASQGFRQLTENLRKDGDFAYGVGVFRDETELEMGYRNLQSITSNVDKAKAALKRIRADGGDDEAEANLIALWKIATGNPARWRSKARRVVLVYGDAMGHEPTCFGDVKLTRSIVIDVLKKARITVVVVGTESAALDGIPIQFGCGRGSAEPGQSTAIATGTGGSLRGLPSGAGSEELVNTFAEVVRRVSQEIDVVESNCHSGLDITYRPPLTSSALRDGPSIQGIFIVKRRVCRAGFFKCRIQFSSTSGIRTRPLVLKLDSFRGC